MLSFIYYTHLPLDEPSPSPTDQLGLVQAPGVQVEHNLDWHIIIQWQEQILVSTIDYLLEAIVLVNCNDFYYDILKFTNKNFKKL